MTSGLDRRSSQPMYQQLVRRLRGVIAELEVGDLLPGEHGICETFGVSRTVVRQALSQLEHDGIVTRIRGKGTFVAPPKVAETLVHTLHGLHDDMTARGATVTSRVFRQETAPAPDEAAAALGVAPEAPVIVIERLRLVDGEPWSLSTTWMPEWAGSAALDADLTEQSLYGVLAERGIRAVRGVRSAEAAIADRAQARMLGVAGGSALLVLRSVGYDTHDRAVEYFRAYHRGDRSRFEFQLRADDESTANLTHTRIA